MIQFSHVGKTYNKKDVFYDFSLQIQHKEFVCLIGHSGSGKSTFFKLLIGEEMVDSGRISIDGVSISALKGDMLQFYRRKIGMIFQDFKLFPKKTVFENIAFPLEVCGEKTENIFSKVKKVLEIVGLEEKIGHFIHELSGGEKQRVAIARALVHNPKIILADEPTGNLDPQNTKSIINLLKLINEKLSVTIIITTHDPNVVQYLNTRVVQLENGKIISDSVRATYS